MQQYVGIAVFAAGAVWLLVQVGMKFWPKKSILSGLNPALLEKTTFLPDEPAPKGTVDYLSMVEFEAPKATEKEWWQYAKMGLSAMAIVRSERNRLGGGP